MCSPGTLYERQASEQGLSMADRLRNFNRDSLASRNIDRSYCGLMKSFRMPFQLFLQALFTLETT